MFILNYIIPEHEKIMTKRRLRLEEIFYPNVVYIEENFIMSHVVVRHARQQMH